MPLEVPGRRRAGVAGGGIGALSRTAATPPPRLEIEDLTRAYGPVMALDGVELDLEPGGFLVLVGPNGAGKTTLVKLVARLVRPTSGSIRLDGEDWLAAPPAAQRRVGVLSHATYLYDGLTAVENLRFYAELYGLADPDAAARRSLAGVGLAAAAGRPARSLSHGQLQRLSIARATLHEPELLLLDEPFSGLDPLATARLGETLEELAAGGRTILLTTHDLSRVPRSADRYAVLVDGRLRATGDLQGTPAELVDRYRVAVGAEGGR